MHNRQIPLVPHSPLCWLLGKGLRCFKILVSQNVVADPGIFEMWLIEVDLELSEHKMTPVQTNQG